MHGREEMHPTFLVSFLDFKLICHFSAFNYVFIKNKLLLFCIKVYNYMLKLNKKTLHAKHLAIHIDLRKNTIFIVAYHY